MKEKKGGGGDKEAAETKGLGNRGKVVQNWEIGVANRRLVGNTIIDSVILSTLHPWGLFAIFYRYIKNWEQGKETQSPWSRKAPPALF